MTGLDANFDYSGIMEESMALKLTPLESHICLVKEELIEYNPDTGMIICYCVVVERATNSLNKLIGIWGDAEERARMKENFSEEKIASIFYNSVYGLAFLHSKDIFYADMKPDNLLVFRDMQVKLGDLGITCKLDCREKDFDKKEFNAKGFTRGFVPDSLKERFESPENNPMSKNEMIRTDIFALRKTFAIVKKFVKKL
jgi:serine/threonine protein kinase